MGLGLGLGLVLGLGLGLGLVRVRVRVRVRVGVRVRVAKRRLAAQLAHEALHGGGARAAVDEQHLCRRYWEIWGDVGICGEM